MANIRQYTTFASLISLGALVVAACSDDPQSSSSGGSSSSSSSSSSGGSSSSSSSGGRTDGGVDAAVPEFDIGGNVAGLMGSVVLQNNAGDDLTVNMSGAFKFSKKVKSGGAYAVTVKTQPASPKQTCTVGMGMGTVANASVSNIRVDCSTDTFDVRANVTGVTGTLVLTNNGGNDLSVTADGLATFTTKVASGGMYDVKVKTQPAGQLCTVAMGAGTVTNAAVTANVTCKTAYTVGGQVVDLLGPLTGAGLVLRNNGANDLAIAAAGNFVFTQPVAAGDPYAVTVFTQPMMPARTCSVTRGSGAMIAANVSDVLVSCGWGSINAFPGGEVNPGVGNFNGFGQMAWDENGNILLPSYSNGPVRRILRATGVAENVGTATFAGIGIAYDPATKIAYLANTGNQVFKYDLNTPNVAPTMLATVTGQGHTVAIAPPGFGGVGGYVVVATSSARVAFINPANGMTTEYTVPAIANGLAFAADKTLYVQLDNGTILKMAPDGTTTAFANVGTNCDGITIDEGRRLIYVASSGSQRIRTVSMVDGTVGMNATAVAFDGGYWPSPILFDGVNTAVVGVTNGGLRLRQVTVP